jgi:hypothetical protein
MTDSGISATSGVDYAYGCACGDVSMTRSGISDTTGSAGYAYGCSCGDVTMTDSGISATSGVDYAYGCACGDVSMTRSGISDTTGSAGYAYGCSCGDVTMTDSSITSTVGGTDSYAYGCSCNNARLTRSSLLDTSAPGTNGYAYGISAGADVILVDSTIAGTAGESFAYAIAADSDVSLTNSTVADNAAWAISTSGPVTLVYSDIVRNGADFVAAAGAAAPHQPVYAAQSFAQVNSGGALTTFGSVIAFPQGVFENCLVDSTTSHGYNFADDTTCDLTGTGDRQGSTLDPHLGVLADNGGPTLTLLPQAGSPLIDAIPFAACQSDGATGITTDQRQLPRPEQAGGTCDIGSVEVQLPPPTPEPEVVEVTPRFAG